MSRIIHCSFCKEEGHNIKHCNSDYRQYFKTIVLQYMAVDHKFELNYNYAIYMLSSYPIESIRVIGFMCDVIQPNMKLLRKKTPNNLRLFQRQLLLLVKGIIQKFDLYYPDCIHQIINDINHDDMVRHSHILHRYIQHHCEFFMSLRQIYNRLFTHYIIIIDFSFISNDLTNTNNDCAICYNELTNNNSIMTNCNHIFCIDCLYRLFDIGKISCYNHPKCPLCRTRIDSLVTHNSIFRDSVQKYQGVPALYPNEITKRRPALLLETYNNAEKKFIVFFISVITIAIADALVLFITFV